MGNSKKHKKLSITLEGDVLGSVRGNAGFFDECGGFGDEVFRNVHSDEPKKVSLTAGQVDSLLNVIDEISVGIKYPTKTGREYMGLMSFRESLINEKKRQLGE